MQRVGIVGLGNMGSVMAWNIHNAGFTLGGYNRSVHYILCAHLINMVTKVNGTAMINFLNDYSSLLCIYL